MATRTGKTVEHGGVLYDFDTEEDAINFEDCVNGGGRPGACAEQHRCIGKRTPEQEKDRGRDFGM